MVQTVLTKDAIERASRREGVSHPVISVLEYHEPRIVKLNVGYSGMSNNHEAWTYVYRNFGFIGDALEEASDFSLCPLDLVAIWSKAMEIWPRELYPRYTLAGMISTSYGIQGRPDLKGLSRYCAEIRKLPDTLVSDRSGLLHVSSRLDDIHTSLGDLDFYVYGTREDAMELAAELTKKHMAGDEEASKEFDRLVAHQKEHTTPLLGAIHENFGNGVIPIVLKINGAINALEVR